MVEPEIYLRSAPGKCCPDASCNYGYYKDLKYPKYCRNCSELCIGCKHYKGET